MDKKNTMLLTVIAVATLLVAVVGATFAFFAISTNTDSATSKITGTTPDVPSSAITLTGSQNIKLTLSAEDMSSANKGYYYYAVNDDSNNAKSTDKAAEADSHKLDIGVASLTGGSKDSIYECTAKYTIKIDKHNASEEEITFADTDEAILYLYAKDANVTLPATFKSGTGIKLSELVAAGDTGISGDVKFKLTATGTLSPVTTALQAALQIKNSDQEQQDDLANKTFNITFTTAEENGFTCDAVESE